MTGASRVAEEQVGDMAQLHWRQEELPWDQIERDKIDWELVPLIKAAALVEFNADDYTAYLCNVFRDDPEFQGAARDWAIEEVQHGVALGRWAERVDPSWSFDAAVARFRAGYTVPVNRETSVRGSRSGELIARCIVETGTSSYYSALGDSCDEPVLRRICRHIAADELRHYKLFYDYVKRYMATERLSKFRRVMVALGRVTEAEDDELAYAYYAANAPSDAVYDRVTYSREYGRRAYARYRPQHLDRGVAMLFKACGLSPRSVLYSLATRAAWWLLNSRVKEMSRAAGEGVAA